MSRTNERLAARPLGRTVRDVLAWVARPGGAWRGYLLAQPLVARLALLGVTLATASCVPRGEPGELPPTLSIETAAGGEVAVQNGIPVPTFGFQARSRIDLDGRWLVERQTFDSDLSLTPRDVALPRIESSAAGRIEPVLDDRGWEPITVPGALNEPPDRTEVGAWYRRTFIVPAAWAGRAVTLKFGAVNYIADVWLNGTWLGYHEGGTTPFAFDVGPALRPGEANVLVVRVDNPAWGSRNDIVPWGLADWWNFGGVTRSVWLEATDPVHVVRADVAPHLDGADATIVLANRGPEPRPVGLRVEVLPALVTDDNLLDPDPRALLTGAPPVASEALDPVDVEAGGIARVDASFLLADIATWSPAAPSLYVLRVTATVDGERVDTLHESFGFRQVAVDPTRPVVLLNGRVVALPGVALHDQRLVVEDGRVTGRLPTPEDILDQLRHAESAGALLIRAGHSPPNPNLLQLTDRLGFAVWEEIPLYHYTPQTFGIALRRGIPQQILREMALRDMNRPSVLFHGLANESTGEEERRSALAELHEVDRAIDGTRLTGQAAYGFHPADTTSEPLDVAGYTMYYGVFYGGDPATGTRQALATAHETYPAKPVVVLEFGRWADGPGGLDAQQRIFEATAPEIFARRATSLGGFVATGVWWTLEDYATLRPSIDIEHFGLFAADGSARPVAASARQVFEQVPAGLEAEPPAPEVPGGRGVSAEATRPGGLLLEYLAFGAAVVLGILGVVLVLMTLRGGRGVVRPARRATDG